MWPWSKGFDPNFKLAKDDIKGIQKLYGGPMEGDDGDDGDGDDLDGDSDDDDDGDIDDSNGSGDGLTYEDEYVGEIDDNGGNDYDEDLYFFSN